MGGSAPPHRIEDTATRPDRPKSLCASGGQRASSAHADRPCPATAGTQTPSTDRARDPPPCQVSAWARPATATTAPGGMDGARPPHTCLPGTYVGPTAGPAATPVGLAPAEPSPLQQFACR